MGYVSCLLPLEMNPQDKSLTLMLSELGFARSSADAALEVLYSSGLTREGKKNIAVSKISKVEELLRGRFVLVCGKTECAEEAQREGSGREVVSAAQNQFCEICGGQNNRHAVRVMLNAMRETGRGKLFILGGSSSSRSELKRIWKGLGGDSSNLRVFSNEDDSPARKNTQPHVLWADVSVIWASTELSHKMTVALVGKPRDSKDKVRQQKKPIIVSRRSIAALAEAVTRSLLGRSSSF